MAQLFVCGDIVNYDNKDGTICTSSLAEIILEADYAVCNFEAPIESSEEPNSKSGPHHFQRKSTLNGLKSQGFDLFCLANNHIMDYGDFALKQTINEIDRLGLDKIGAGINFESAYKPLVKTIDNLRVGFVNACEAQFGVLDYNADKDQPGYAWINHNEIDKQIIELKKKCDFVIVLAHAGLEHYNIPQKEWRMRYKHFCDLGANVVVGSHPHVPQGYERYDNALIFYSLGNFYFDSQKYRMKEDRSYSVILKLEKDEEVDYELVFHHKEAGNVQLSPNEKKVDIELLNSKLKNDYEKLHDAMSSDVYNRIIKKNLIYSLLPFPYDGKIKSSIKRVLKLIMRRSKKIDKNLLLLHLIRNEAYYYATKHALDLTTKENGRR